MRSEFKPVFNLGETRKTSDYNKPVFPKREDSEVYSVTPPPPVYPSEWVERDRMDKERDDFDTDKWDDEWDAEGLYEKNARKPVKGKKYKIHESREKDDEDDEYKD